MREVDHLPPSRADVKNSWSYTSTSPYVFMAWCLGTAYVMAWYLVKPMEDYSKHLIFRNLLIT